MELCNFSIKGLFRINGNRNNDANKKVYVVTVSESYFFNAILPKILYRAYPIPEHIPVKIPKYEIVSKPLFVNNPLIIPVVRIQPSSAINREINFCLVIFSWKNIEDNIITKHGAVYSKIAAIDKDVSLIVIKYITLKKTMLNIPVHRKIQTSLIAILNLSKFVIKT